ncbi:MAG: UDP-N-acetylglucosamine 1-carboxyvinyltransferase [Eubacteriales bacterium]|nr:UDP-N-acetylglucosamine 1-carboxyvinyltransferase [Eubacteriales bacterium]
MEQYVIKGGIPLNGDVTISGAKNAALGILAASIMTNEKVRVNNAPYVNDIIVMLDAIEEMGGTVERIDEHTVVISGKGIDSRTAGNDSLRNIRAGYYFIGALLGKSGYARVPLPGGCDIGSRPIDQHIKGFKALGADVKIENGIVIAKADHLRAAHIYFDVVSVGATINLMMASCMAEGQTILENVAKEPHIVDVANFLNSMGAKIKGAGTDTIRIVGVPRLMSTEYDIIPDQIEAGTFMCMAAATKGDITVRNVIPKHLESIGAKLVEMGNKVYFHNDTARVIGVSNQTHTDIKTLPYPGFPTDMQPQITTILCLAEGTSVVTENIFENRFRYVDELRLMGAQVKVEGNVAVVEGIDAFQSANLRAPDLRAGAALVMAALAADGISTVTDISYILRGYEDFDKKIRGLGGQIELCDDDRDVTKFRLRIG